MVNLSKMVDILTSNRYPVSMEQVQDTRQVRLYPPIILNGRLVNTYTLSKELGIDQSYLRKVLSGKRTPTIEYALKISSILGFPSIDDFLSAISARKVAVRPQELQQVS